jgi:hypothetical protein
MRLLPLLEDKRESGTIWYEILRQSPKVWFAGVLAIDTETLLCDVSRQGSSHVGEGIFGCVFRSVSPDGRLVQVRGIDPSDGRSGHAEGVQPAFRATKALIYR